MLKDLIQYLVDLTPMLKAKADMPVATAHILRDKIHQLMEPIPTLKVGMQ